MFYAGAQGVHEDGEWLVTHFEPGTDTSSFLAAVRAADGRSVIESGAVVSVDWSIAWRDRLVSHPVGRLTIAPPWLAGSSDPSTTVIVDPGMAFGTGDHATTRGVLRLMQQVIRAGDVVADLGSGSGVLAIAAAKLGASRVAAIEIDPDAIANAEENVVRNDVAGQVTVLEGDARVAEIARMLGGDPESDVSRAHARELLESAAAISAEVASTGGRGAKRSGKRG